MAVPACPSLINIFVRFEIYNPTSTNISKYDPVGPGVEIDLMDHDSLSGDDLLDKKNTDENGLVTFTNRDYPSKAGEKTPDIYFKARVKNMKLVNRWTPPDDWSTKGWTDVFGRPGYYPNWTPSDLGTLDDPLVFRIGVEFHLQLSYTRLVSGPEEWIAPPGIPVLAHAYNGVLGQIPLIGIAFRNDNAFRTDKKGQVHGLVFNVSPDQKVTFVIHFQIVDKSINLQPAWVEAYGPGSARSPREYYWITDGSGSDADTFDAITVPPNWIGTPTEPKKIRTTVGDKNVAMFFLSILYEFNAFLFAITGKQWKGFGDGITYTLTTLGGTSYSWPVGKINIDPRDHWNRSVIVHETAHQIMWQEADIGTIRIGFEYLFVDGKMVHWTQLLYTGFQALTEGWAEFFEAIFCGPSQPGYNTPPWDVSSVDDNKKQFKSTHTNFGKNWIQLSPPWDGIGQYVEGAFSDALWQMYRDFVVAGASTEPHVLEVMDDYEVVNGNAWVTDPAVQGRFQTTIWKAVDGLASRGKTTADFIDTIRQVSLVNWRNLAGYFQSFNMFVPSVDGKSMPTSSPNAGGGTATITGQNFVDAMQVVIGGQNATVTVQSSTSLTCTIPAANPPAPAGGSLNVDITVWYQLRVPAFTGNSPATWPTQMQPALHLPGAFIYQG